MEIRNMTPHEIVVLDDSGLVKATFLSEGTIRLSEKKSFSKMVEGICVFLKSYGNAELPPMRTNTMYIVSFAVANCFPMRRDFLVPDQIVRNPNGSVRGCLSFTQVEE